MPIPGRTADLRRTASLLLFLTAAVFTAGAVTDAPLVRPLLKLTCHRLPERSFSWAPGLCARCTFFWTGVLVSSALMFFRKLPGSLAAGLFMIAPLVVDGSLQFAGFYQSTNTVRLITGLLAGTGVCLLFEAGIRTE
jgi:uncharacterized membrane protein